MRDSTVIDNLSRLAIDDSWLHGLAEIVVDDFAALPAGRSVRPHLPPGRARSDRWASW